eukprot:3999274-Heterocapsa_arctica.AAC.1
MQQRLWHLQAKTDHLFPEHGPSECQAMTHVLTDRIWKTTGMFHDWPLTEATAKGLQDRLASSRDHTVAN